MDNVRRITKAAKGSLQMTTAAIPSHSNNRGTGDIASTVLQEGGRMPRACGLGCSIDTQTDRDDKTSGRDTDRQRNRDTKRK